MKIVKPYATIINEPNQFKLIERIGRICYKSEENITDNSFWTFLYNLFIRKHYAMLEHGHIHVKAFYMTDEEKLELSRIPYVILDEIDSTVISNRYTIVTISYSHLAQYATSNGFIADVYRCLIQDSQYSELDKAFSFMSRDIPQNCSYDLGEGTLFIIDEPELEDICLDSLHNHRLWNRHHFESIHFICDRGISHELVRSRCSVAQESTRYCNYASDKFGNVIQFIQPVTISDSEDSKIGYPVWLKACEDSENHYNFLLSLGYKPQDARSVLVHSVKTEVVLTMNLEQLKHFIDLRYRGTTGAPHPDMKYIVGKLLNKHPEFKDIE